MPGTRGLCGFFLQSSHEDDDPSDIADYGNPTLAKCQAIHNHTYEAYLAVSTVLSLDHSIYGKLIKDLYSSYSMVTDQYPRTRAKMNSAISHCLCAPPSAVFFAQNNDDGPTSR